MATSFKEAQALIDRFVERVEAGDKRAAGSEIYRYSSTDAKRQRRSGLFKRLVRGNIWA